MSPKNMTKLWITVAYFVITIPGWQGWIPSYRWSFWIGDMMGGFYMLVLLTVDYYYKHGGRDD